LNLIGQVAVLAGVDYALAEFAADALRLPRQHGEVLIVYGLVLVSHGVLNHVGVKVVTVLNELSAWYHLVGTALLVAALAAWAPRQPASFLLRHFVAPEPERSVTYVFWYASLVGLLQAQWTFTGYDASAHAAEETVGAREAAPCGIVTSVWVSGAAGWIMLLALTLAIRDLPAAAGAKNAFVYILDKSLGGRLGAAMLWMVIGAMWFCGLSTLTSNSRMLFAFARDGGLPGSARLASVSPRFRTPTWAVWSCVAIAFALAIWSRALSVIVAISTIGLYASYGLPIWLAWRARRRGKAERGPWNLGRWSSVVNAGAIVWIGIITVLFMLPPNERTGITFAALLGLLSTYYFAWARDRFEGPAQLKTSGQPAIQSRPTAGSES
jgi:amino acid transporter